MHSYDRRRKRVLKRFFVGLTLFSLSFTLLFILNLFLASSFPEFADGGPLVWVALTSALAVLLYPLVDQAYTWLFRFLLFPRRSRIFAILDCLSEEVALTTDLGELANLVVNTLGEVLHLKTVSLLVRAPREEGYLIASAHGWSVTDYRKVRLQKGDPLLGLIRASGNPVLLLDRIAPNLTWQEANELTGNFERIHATGLIPLWVQEELVGSVNLSSFASERPLDTEDLRLLKDFGGRIALAVRNARLLQELKIQNHELRDKQSQLLQEAKLTAIEQLASGIAHEIHNPLTIISGKAQVLLLQKERKSYDERVEEVLKTIVHQTRRAAEITKKLLMFSRASASPREKLRLEGVLEDTISLIAYRTSLEGIEIRRFIGQDLPDFIGNVQEMREVFLNLILNALQAIGAGGVIQVGITFQKADKVFVIQVADSGPGIPAEDLDKVFNPFFTTRPEGTGLGLFVTQQIVHRYGGSIRAESQPGEGTLFVIELPLEAPIPPASSGPVIPELGGFETEDAALGI